MVWGSGSWGSGFGSFLVNRSDMKLLMVAVNTVKPASISVRLHVMYMHSASYRHRSGKKLVDLIKQIFWIGYRMLSQLILISSVLLLVLDHN